jgi:hypothetical protein
MLQSPQRATKKIKKFHRTANIYLVSFIALTDPTKELLMVQKPEAEICTGRACT